MQLFEVTKGFISFRLRGGMLYYVLFISSMVILMTSSLFMLVKFHFQYLDIFQHKNELLLQNQSVHNMVCAAPEKFEFDKVIKQELFENNIHSTLYKKQWGAYNILNVTSTYRSLSHSLTGYAGCNFQAGENVALYLADQRKYVSLAGNSRIFGDAYLPKLGVRTAYIEGDGYTGDSLIYGNQKTSEQKLPALDPLFFKTISDYQTGVLSINDTLLSSNVLNYIELIYSWDNKPGVILSEKPVTIHAQHIMGPVIVISSKSIAISNKSDIDGCIFLAPIIQIEDHTSGSFQAYAHDTLILGDNCHLKFPSVVGVLNQAANNIVLYAGKNTHVEGGIVLYQQRTAQEEPHLKIGEASSVTGIIYCPGKLELMGNVTGSVYCNNFYLKTKSAWYENHIYNIKIDARNVSTHFASPLFFTPVELKIIEWLTLE